MLRHKFLGAVVCGGLVLWATGAAGADMAHIYVNTTRDVIAKDGQCALREAIAAVNTLKRVNECPKGTKNTIIHIPAGLYYVDASKGRFIIKRGMYLKGAGLNATRIDGLEQTGLFAVVNTTTRKVILEDMALVWGNAYQGAGAEELYLGGAIAHEQGFLAIRRVWCATNTGGCYAKPFALPNNGVYFEDVHVYSNRKAPGIYSTGTTHLNRTLVNEAWYPDPPDGSIKVGGLWQWGGTLILEIARIVENVNPLIPAVDCWISPDTEVIELQPNLLGVGCAPAGAM